VTIDANKSGYKGANYLPLTNYIL